MNVARLKLCKQLYELSGWKETDFFWQLAENEYLYEEANLGYVLVNPVLEEPLQSNAYPAYDLGYLLRKFAGRGGIELRYGDRECAASSPLCCWGITADTPENVVCALAIELLKHGYLMRSDL